MGENKPLHGGNTYRRNCLKLIEFMEVNQVKNRYGIIGNSPNYIAALETAIRVANTNLTVLITGESGSGKEVFSKIIHDLSQRRHNNFIAVNCGAIPEGTIDSELFGHEKGSFTGAADTRKGYFEFVNGGTIFLDEIGEMPLGTQARLLRVLETGEFIKVGSSKPQKTDVRVIAATNRPLLDAISKGKFREDLYYRLNTVPIKVPSLRERKDDIHLIFKKFCNDFAEKYKITSVKLDENAVKVLQNYRWGGNVRELKNIAEQISALSDNKLISADELLKFLPNEQMSLTPVLANFAGVDDSKDSFNSERDILYKFLFDMKKDMNDLKNLVFNLVNKNNLKMPDMEVFDVYDSPNVHINPKPLNWKGNENIIIKNDGEVITHFEETLSLADKEHEMIISALKKHKGRRRDAALELGISERTLYRKIKEYDIKE